MKFIGEHKGRKTYFLDINKEYQDILPFGNWVCFAIANEEPDSNDLDKFIRLAIEKDLSEFKGQGSFGEYMHDIFDETMVALEVLENHPEISICTTGDNKTDLANGFWEAYYVNAFLQRVDYDNIKIICISFDGNDYSKELSELIEKFNQNWLP